MTEVQLPAGWLRRDVQRASARMDEWLRSLRRWGRNFATVDGCELSYAIDELLALRVVVHELRQNMGIVAIELADRDEENAHLRARCTWLQERRAVLRKLLSAKWSKRREVRALRAKLAKVAAELVDYKDAAESEADAVNQLTEEKRHLLRRLAAGPVMPEMPSGAVVSAICGEGSPLGFYEAIRNVLAAEQNGAR